MLAMYFIKWVYICVLKILKYALKDLKMSAEPRNRIATRLDVNFAF